jgi:hypothetical protein
MLDALLELIFEFIVEFLFQIIVDIGFECFAETFRKHRSLPPFLAWIIIPLVGGLVGLFWSKMFPQRILRGPEVPGTSLLLAPLCTGVTMKLFGDWRRRSGRQPTTLATFWGGALFAFSMALVRWLRVGRVV